MRKARSAGDFQLAATQTVLAMRSGRSGARAVISTTAAFWTRT
ncbi:hypothetical protein [Nonomuraea insulae]|uniref:Uncharacterized protein n=1 Tax=Nonomuraea insulae TaxID=1616787 RepID=A0ABW1DAQ0_9ACTN